MQNISFFFTPSRIILSFTILLFKWFSVNFVYVRGPWLFWCCAAGITLPISSMPAAAQPCPRRAVCILIGWNYACPSLSAINSAGAIALWWAQCDAMPHAVYRPAQPPVAKDYRENHLVSTSSGSKFFDPDIFGTTVCEHRAQDKSPIAVNTFGMFH